VQHPAIETAAPLLWLGIMWGFAESMRSLVGQSMVHTNFNTLIVKLTINYNLTILRYLSNHITF